MSQKFAPIGMNEKMAAVTNALQLDMQYMGKEVRKAKNTASAVVNNLRLPIRHDVEAQIKPNVSKMISDLFSFGAKASQFTAEGENTIDAKEIAQLLDYARSHYKQMLRDDE